MRVLLAGASGVLGRAMLPLLAAAGHHIIGQTSSRAGAEFLHDQHASQLVDVLIVDALNASAVTEAVARARPDVIVNQLTALSPARGKDISTSLGRTARLRVEGARNLVAAAQAAGVGRLVAQSLAFAAAPAGQAVADELAPLYLDAPDPWGLTCRAIATLENLVTGTPGLAGIVLRYGTLYGTEGALAGVATAVRAGRLPAVTGGSGRWSFSHVDDAAAAAVHAVTTGPSGVYNIVDDDPARHDEWLPVYAAALGAPRPPVLSAEQAWRQMDWYDAYRATTCPGAINTRARDRLGWAPTHPSWRESLGAVG